MEGDNYEKQRHALFHGFTPVVGESAFTMFNRIELASPEVEKRMEHEYIKVAEDRDISLLQLRNPMLATFLGRVYEYRALEAIAQRSPGESFMSRFAGVWEGPPYNVAFASNSNETESRLIFPVTDSNLKSFKNLSEVEPGHTLYIPKNSNNPSYDGLIVSQGSLAERPQLVFLQTKRISPDSMGKISFELSGIIKACRHFGLLKRTENNEPSKVKLCFVQQSDSFEISRPLGFSKFNGALLADEVWPQIEMIEVCVDLWNVTRRRVD